MTHEDFLRQQLIDLHREYQARALPIANQLAAIAAHELKPMVIVMTADEAARLGIRIADFPVVDMSKSS